MAVRPRQVEIYERLSQYYDTDWGRYAGQYVDMLLGYLAADNLKPAKILDLACGTGNLAMGLANNGHIVHGVDLSPAMIDHARYKTADMRNISFELHDMTRFRVSDTYDVVTCTFDSINYVRNLTALRGMLRRVRNSLTPRGLFVFDSNTARLYAKHHSGVLERTIDGDLIIQRLSFEPQKNLARTVFEFPDGEVEEHLQRPYDLPELKPLLEGADLRVLETRSHFDGTPFTSKSERLICTAGRS